MRRQRKPVSTPQMLGISSSLLLGGIDNCTDYSAPSTDMKALVLRDPGEASRVNIAEPVAHRKAWTALGPYVGICSVSVLSSDSIYKSCIQVFPGNTPTAFRGRVPAPPRARKAPNAFRMTFDLSSFSKTGP